MGTYRWDASKNDKLMRERRVSFEEVLLAIDQGRLLDVIDNPNKEKYGGQKAFVVEIRHYVYLIPFLDRGDEIFLKTIIPTRKLTKKYLKEE
ncbi:MAG: BrnT family toxin [Candidatus Omnitrophica bacterium]|nr:BrnT family toxin [Candidatus Omnitrophota bacterium]